MESITGKRILVTGGSGFVGSHVVELLLQKKAHVIVPVRSIIPQSYFVTQNLHKKVQLVYCDIADPKKIFDVVCNFDIHTILHLAAEAIVTTAYKNPEETLRTNIFGTIQILEAARQLKSVKKIIIASSDKAYGKSKQEYTENMPLIGDHPYEVSKSAADLISQMYQKTYHLPVIISRFGNIYGPGDMHGSRIVPGIMKAIITKQTLLLRSDGTFVRDYVYVKDVALAYYFMLQKFDVLSKQAYNLGSNDTFSVLDLIKKSEQVLKKPCKFHIENSQINEIPYQHLNWKRIHSFGWKPKYKIEQGLKETYSWYNKEQKSVFFI